MTPARPSRRLRTPAAGLLACLLATATACAGPQEAPPAVRLIEAGGAGAETAKPRAEGTPAPAARLVSVTGPAVPDRGDRSDVGERVPSPGRLARVALTRDGLWDQRVALLAVPGTVYTYRVAVPDAASEPVLRLAVGVLAPPGGEEEGQRGDGGRRAEGDGGGDEEATEEEASVEEAEDAGREASAGEERGTDAAAGDAPLPAAPDAPIPLRFRIELAPPGGEAREVFADEAVHRPGDPPDDRWREVEVDLAAWGGETVGVRLVTERAAGAAAGDRSAPPVGAWAVPEVAGSASRQPGWDVLFVSLDTLRADHLSAYGYPRPTSPHLDALAERGLLFRWAVAQAPWTRPSHRSMFNGLYPASNGGLESPFLAELLWSAGWRTAAITGGGQIDPRFGFDRGLERYAIVDWVEEPEVVLDHLERGAGRSQFLFLHTYRIHDPYHDSRFTGGLPAGRIGERFGEKEWRALGRELTEEEKAYVTALYDGGIAAADEALGRILDALEARGALDHTIVVVTSDHGEQLWDHGGWRHGQHLYDHQLLVPLVVHLPPALEERIARGGIEERVVGEQVELVDLYPTLLELLEIPYEHRVQGRSLVPLLAGGSLPPRDAFAENTNINKWERKGFRSKRFKMIKSLPKRAARRQWDAEPYFELFDLRRDPGETKNLAEEHPELVAVLDERITAMRRGAGALDEELPAGIDPDLAERLRALGYLGGE